MSLEECVGLVAPYYNLALVAIVITLFIKLFRTPNQKAFIRPWKLLFFSVLVYVIEEILTVFNKMEIINVPKLVFPLLEMIIITSFIYMLLIQKAYTDLKK